MTEKLKVTKEGSKWAVGHWLFDSGLWLGDFYKTKREALERLDYVQTYLANAGRSSQADIYDAKGNWKENIYVLAAKEVSS